MGTAQRIFHILQDPQQPQAHRTGSACRRTRRQDGSLSHHRPRPLHLLAYSQGPHSDRIHQPRQRRGQNRIHRSQTGQHRGPRHIHRQDLSIPHKPHPRPVCRLHQQLIPPAPHNNTTQQKAVPNARPFLHPPTSSNEITLETTVCVGRVIYQSEGTYIEIKAYISTCQN